MLGDTALANDPNFASNVERVKRRAETDGRVAAVFGALDIEPLIAKLAAADIAFARVNDPAGLAQHPHLRRIAVATAGGVTQLSGAAGAPRRRDAPLRRGAGARRAHRKNPRRVHAGAC